MNPRALCLILLLPLPGLAQPPAPGSARAGGSDSASVPTPPKAPAHPLRVSAASTSAFGLRATGFFNQLVGARLDYRFTPRFAFGGALSYANLKGKDGRVHNLLPEAIAEYRIALAGERFGVPLRFATGFLPQNGPTLRVSAGVDFGLSERVSLELTPLEPMVWVNRERPELSLNGSLALRAAF
jgi:hypothetical protein